MKAIIGNLLLFTSISIAVRNAAAQDEDLVAVREAGPFYARTLDPTEDWHLDYYYTRREYKNPKRYEYAVHGHVYLTGVDVSEWEGDADEPSYVRIDLGFWQVKEGLQEEWEVRQADFADAQPYVQVGEKNHVCKAAGEALPASALPGRDS